MHTISTTLAIRYPRGLKAEFNVFQYEYIPKGEAKQKADELGVELHNIVKTLVLQGKRIPPFIVLKYGNKGFSTQGTARYIFPSDKETATNWTGHVFGGTSSFCMHKPMRILLEKSIFELKRIYINVKITPNTLTKILDYKLACITSENKG